MGAGKAVIAIVDDDESVRRALSRRVRHLSYDSVCFASGEAFLATLDECHPDCVLMDYHMPGLRGVDVLDRIRHMGNDLPTIIITGLDQPGMRQKCLEAGAACYLTKPLDVSVLAEAIDGALHSERAGIKP